MGQGGAKSKRGCKKSEKPSPNAAGPDTTSSLSSRQKNARALLQTVTLAYVHKNIILQHKTCSMLTHDSNDIKNVT